MQLLVVIFSVIIFVKTLSYGIFERKNNNKIGGNIVIVIALISFALPNLVVYFKGIY